MENSPLELQQNPNFGYSFRLITLLYEALTHSFDNPERTLANGNVCYKKKSFHRLKMLGTSGLDLLCVEQAIRENDTTATLNQLIEYSQNLQSDEILKSLGHSLELHRFIEVKNTYPAHKIENLYPDVIRAIVGAVLVDSSNYAMQNNNMLIKTQHFLCQLYSGTGYFTKKWEDDPFDAYFPTNETSAKLEFPCDPETLYESIQYEFGNKAFLQHALTQSDESNYQRLQLLGIAVWELVICEYLFWYYINDDNGTHFNSDELEKYTSPKYQQVVADSILLSKYIAKPTKVHLQNMDMFLQSLIGAIYLDSLTPFVDAKRVIVWLCNETGTKHLKAKCAKLPHKLKTYYNTSYRLKNPKQCFNLNKIFPEEESPEINNQFEIQDVVAFVKNWEYFTRSMEEHQKLLKITLKEAKHPTRKMLSLQYCNRAEFTRRTLYGIAAEKLMQMGIKSVSILEEPMEEEEGFEKSEKCIARELMTTSQSLVDWLKWLIKTMLKVVIGIVIIWAFLDDKPAPIRPRYQNY